MAYVLLALVGLGAAAYTIWISERKPQLITVLLTATALLTQGDWVVFGWFRLFAYHPHLVANPRVDEVWGQVLAESLFLPSLLVFLLARVPDAVGLVVFAGAATAIEYFFLRWGLFVHTGWRLWYTTAGLALYYVAINRLWISIRTKSVTEGSPARLLRFSVVFAAVSSLSLYLRAHQFGTTNIHILPTAPGNQSLGRFLTYGLVTIPVGYWAASAQGKARWARLGAATAFFVGFNLFLAAVGFRTFPRAWTALTDGVVQGVAILVAAWLQDVIMAMERERVHV